ncbi:MAG: hypothetical protein ACW981_03045 [Candidatus Hodarchaeales archaeon]|jgi:hypothetical protein
MDNNQSNDSEKAFKTCNTCQKNNPINSSYCMSCGSILGSLKSQKAEDSNTNVCPVCGKKFPEDVKFCLFDGNPIEKVSEKQVSQTKDETDSEIIQKKKSNIEEKNNVLYQFSGFEISANGLYSNLPLELLRSSTSILNPSPKAPNDVKLINTSDFFSVLAPKPKLTFFSSFSEAGLTRKNLTSYLITYLFITSLFLLWMVGTLSLDLVINSPTIITTILIWSLIVTLIFVFPVIFTGKIVARIQSEMVFKIEPTFLVLSFAINIFVLQIPFPFPIIVFPGEMKIKTLPSKEELSKAIYKGLVLSFILLIISTFFFFLSNTILQSYFNENFLITSNLGFLIASLALSINLLPFGNMFGKLAKFRPIRYWTMTIITFLILMTAISMISMVE